MFFRSISPPPTYKSSSTTTSSVALNNDAVRALLLGLKRNPVSVSIPCPPDAPSTNAI